jgi:tetratricopeptide (TPR) repeat protein
VTPAAQRAARLALDTAQPAFDRLGRANDPAEIAEALIEAWGHTEQALQSVAGTVALAGQGLVHELRQRSLLTLAEAHALIDFQAAVDRVRRVDYTATAADARAARDGHDRVLELIERGGPPAAGAERTRAAKSEDAAPAPAALPFAVADGAVQRNLLGRVLIGGSVLALLGVAGYYAFTFNREPADLRRGRAAFVAGDRLTAKNAFSAAAGAHPGLAEPHIYLGRMAREEGDFATASVELRRAVALEPRNPLTHRELAAYLLATNQLELARAFYERAIRLAPDDKNALGFMGCTLVRLGRFDLAPRFLQRAGPGTWQTCAAAATVPPPAPPPP